jgi:prevent-host-death family protein
MIASVRESKARLSELLERAVAGEDVVITVRGKPTARLVAVHPEAKQPDRSQWIAELRGFHRNQPQHRNKTPAEELVSLLREERT